MAIQIGEIIKASDIGDLVESLAPDAELNATSTHSIQNKAVYESISSIRKEYDKILYSDIVNGVQIGSSYFQNDFTVSLMNDRMIVNGTTYTIEQLGGYLPKHLLFALAPSTGGGGGGGGGYNGDDCPSAAGGSCNSPFIYGKLTFIVPGDVFTFNVGVSGSAGGSGGSGKSGSGATKGGNGTGSGGGGGGGATGYTGGGGAGAYGGPGGSGVSTSIYKNNVLMFKTTTTGGAGGKGAGAGAYHANPYPAVAGGSGTYTAAYQSGVDEHIVFYSAGQQFTKRDSSKWTLPSYADYAAGTGGTAGYKAVGGNGTGSGGGGGGDSWYESEDEGYIAKNGGNGGSGSSGRIYLFV